MSKIKANEISNLAGDAPPTITGGYTYVRTLYYTSPGKHQFVKANYPWLRGIRATVTGAGGGGGGSGVNGRGGGSGAAGATGIKWFQRGGHCRAAVQSERGRGRRRVGRRGGRKRRVAGWQLVVWWCNGARRTAGQPIRLWPWRDRAVRIRRQSQHTRRRRHIGRAGGRRIPGLGGASYWGGGPRTPAATSNRPGVDGRAPGTGGSGGYRHNANVAGGTGANGIVVLELYA